MPTPFARSVPGMAWDSLEMYTNGLDFFAGVVDSVPDGAWDRPSPCAGWTALDVLGHVGQATAMGSAILAGEPIAFAAVQPPREAVTGVPASWWAEIEAAGRAAAESVEDLDAVVESPMGSRTVREGLSFPAVDLFIHGWDLAAAAGRSIELPPEAIEFTEAMFAQIPDDVSRVPGVFGPRRHAGHEASPTAKLIAFTGRDPEFGG